MTGYIYSFVLIAMHCMLYFILHIYWEFPTRVAFRLMNGRNSNLEFSIARFHWKLGEQGFAELKTCELKFQWQPVTEWEIQRETLCEIGIRWKTMCMSSRCDGRL